MCNIEFQQYHSILQRIQKRCDDAAEAVLVHKKQVDFVVAVGIISNVIANDIILVMEEI